MRILKSHPLLRMVNSYLIDSPQSSKSKLYRFSADKSKIFLHNGIPAVPHSLTPVRPFSSTSVRKADPVGFTALSFFTPYPSSILTNPVAGAFIVLIGMAATLFLTTSDLSIFFAGEHTLGEILRRIDNLFLLYERFLVLELNEIERLFANLDNLNPGTLTNFYFVLQELVAVRESLFNILTELINSPYIELLPRPVVDRINDIYEDLRLGGNNLMGLIREIEDILNIPREERIPSF